MITPDDEKLINNLLKGEYMEEKSHQVTIQWSYAKNGLMISENHTGRFDTVDEKDVFRADVLKTVQSTVGFPNDIGKNIATPPSQTVEALGSCPKCGAPLVMATKKDGTPYKKCSTNKWDRVNKRATGCDFVKWDI